MGTKLVCFCLVLVTSSCILADPIPQKGPADDCLQKDSISCLQLQTYRSLKSFFAQDNIELFGGISLVKNAEPKGRSLEPKEEADITETNDVEKRENILEDFAVQKVMNFFQERSLRWNLAPVVNEVAETARSVADSIPADMKTKISNFIEEGRGKKKKLMKHIGPLLIGLKMKLAAFAALAYIVIALIAKKALLASLLSLLISGFIAIKKLLSHHSPHHEVVEHHPHGWSGSGYSSGGWDSYGGGGGGGHDIHGSYSNNVAHTLAYGGQKASR
ncbi:hypothetical protein V9T40_002912 [Parthenolecanium corni]|uniref:Uncharacterized protein n=1 Tax=Parthenolecanium corni TaxID=536013 RepID=A0AAN9TL91_9HEMI